MQTCLPAPSEPYGAEGRRKGRVSVPAPAHSTDTHLQQWAAQRHRRVWCPGEEASFLGGKVGLGMKRVSVLAWDGIWEHHRACSWHKAPPLPVLGLPGNGGVGTEGQLGGSHPTAGLAAL